MAPHGTTTQHASGTPMPPANRKRPAAATTTNDGKQRTGSDRDAFDFARLWAGGDDDRDDAVGAAAPPSRSATAAQPVHGTPSPAIGRVKTSPSSAISNSSGGGGGSSAGSSGGSGSGRRPGAGSTGLGSGGRRAGDPSAVPSGGADAEGPEDINELLGLIGDRLNRRFDTKKRKLESFAEKALNEAQKALQEHARQHYELMDKKIGEHTQRLQTQFTVAAADRARMRQLQDGYQRAFATLMTKVEQVDVAIQEEDERWATEMQELNEARRQHLHGLQAQLVDSLKATRNVLRTVDEDQDEAQVFKTSLHTMLANF